MFSFALFCFFFSVFVLYCFLCVLVVCLFVLPYFFFVYSRRIDYVQTLKLLTLAASLTCCLISEYHVLKNLLNWRAHQ